MKTKKGFTLIELLLVVGVISILTSVIFFRVTEAKKKAEDVHMVSQSAQVARAVYQYKEDNGFVPRPLTSTGPDYTGEYLESDPRYTEAFDTLVPEYLPSVPRSPSGTGYVYIVSEDGKEAVFAADLNFARSGGGGSRKNSCELVLKGGVIGVIAPPPFTTTTYGSCSLVQTGTCVPTSTIECITVTGSITTSTLNTYCDATNRTLYPWYEGAFPSSLCQIGQYLCPYPLPGNPSTCYYVVSPPNTSREYSCNYTVTIPEPPTAPICSGELETDYCECL